MATRAVLALALLGPALGFAACVLDFSKYEGDGGSTTSSSASASCTNQKQDGAETAVDCGGGDCDPCANGRPCLVEGDCQSHFCSAETCAPCTAPSDCAALAESYCDPANHGGTCTPRHPDGDACTGAEACQSALCVDDVCCDTACDGLCQTCSAALSGQTGGTCAAIAGGTDPGDECAGALVCDGAPLGAACTDLCGLAPQPPGGTCPAACTGGCPGGDTCVIDCAAANACSSASLACPAGFACDVRCSGGSACRGATITCPESYACSVSCTGGFGCRDAQIACSDAGVCDLTCGTANGACQATVMTCGVNTCTGTCAGGNALPTLVCDPGSACACTPC